MFWWFFEFFQVSILFHPCRPQQQTTGNSLNNKTTPLFLGFNWCKDTNYLRSRPEILPSRVDKFGPCCLIVHHCSFDFWNWFQTSVLLQVVNEGEMSSSTVCGLFCWLPQHNFGCFRVLLQDVPRSGLRFSNEPLWFFQIVLVTLHKVLCL